MHRNAAIFLDRDGTLNKDNGYVHTWEAWQWIAGVPEALAELQRDGWRLVVVSNQSGIARGYFDEATLKALVDAVTNDLASHGVSIAGWYHCPHLPEISGPCECRKPSPGLLLRAAEELGIDLPSSWMIGDSISDAQAGLAAGCRPIILAADTTSAMWGRQPLSGFTRLPVGRGMNTWESVPVLTDMTSAHKYILDAEDRGRQDSRQQDGLRIIG